MKNRKELGIGTSLLLSGSLLLVGSKSVEDVVQDDVNKGLDRDVRHSEMTMVEEADYLDELVKFECPETISDYPCVDPGPCSCGPGLKCVSLSNCAWRCENE
jgi:hypothetical protein